MHFLHLPALKQYYKINKHTFIKMLSKRLFSEMGCLLSVLAFTTITPKASAQMPGDKFNCSQNTILEVLRKDESGATFSFSGKHYEFVETSTPSMTFTVFGDTRSPSGNGISFSNHGITVKLGNKKYSCT